MRDRDEWERRRADMTEEQIVGRDVKDERVLAAMRTVPRHLFVPPEYSDMAYIDRPLPIGERQTISQPYMVAKMTALLCANDSAAGQGLKVLEIGCGSGYQAAVLAAMGLKVWSVERIGVLAAAAAERLRPLGVSVIHGDGRMGYPDAAPYDRVIVTAAASRVEAAWDAQLKRGGRLVAPINVTTGNQRLLVRDKLLSDTDGFRNTWYDYCRFVPLLGGVEE